jgi:tetratricopeptide (TPR) repeat protein
MGDLVATNAIVYGQRGDLTKAIDYLKAATELNPRLVDAWANLGNAYRMTARRLNSPDAEKYFELSAKCSKKLTELGFVHPNDVPQFTSAGRPQ